ncbi:DUF2069 domain-containing protein [Halomonas sp. DQ26W]|uniref:DUF2069 domain-containing protein n=1 Tax=Halomonas sp. DQ26W TaxID=2282311 RepID=UPI000DF7A7C0|nr:DUF2069 domain-containing protein [Halomonas sp. DQ26W]RDB43335.1 DUF2069 domain-containing protein [Halomonas sp. DQ26W]
MRRWLEEMEGRHGLDSLTDRSRQLVLGSFGLLVVLMMTWVVVLQDEGISLGPMLAFILPLILFLPSIIGRRPRGHAWLAFVSLLYFMIGVNVAILPGVGLLGMLIALSSLALFTGCMFYARFRSRQMKAASGA